MVRRNVLSGASSWEREEKANQQRDYAAQLQEQVLQKQAKQEQEKARRRQEQREETELLERERAAATRKLQPQQEPAAPDPVPPAASPQRSVSMPHTSTIDLQQHTVPTASTLQSASVGPGFISVGINPGAPMTGSAVFKSAPSIFESLLREPGIGARSSAFYDDLAALQRLAVELDSAAKQKRATAQNNYVKPNFLHQEETEATSTNATSTPLSSPVKLLSPVKLPSPMKFDDEKVEIQAKNQHHQPKARSSLDGLLGESVLLPLGTTKLPSSYPHSMPTRRVGGSPIKSLQQFSSATETDDDDTTTFSVDALDNHSEMLHFTNSRLENY